MTTTHKAVRDVQDADDDVYVLGLLESAQPNGWNMLFMQGEADADPDDDLDSYCVVVDPGQATMYGGVTFCAIEEPGAGSEADHVLRLRFTPEAAETLDVPTEMVLALEIGPDGLALLRRGLRRVLTSGRRADRPTVLSL